jgi:hypothetical protein
MLAVVDPITAALAAGATAGLTSAAATAVEDAYRRLTSALADRFPGLRARVEALEARPNDAERQASLTEGLVRAGAPDDAELLGLALVVLEAVGRDAPQAAPDAGVDLERVTGAFVNVERVSGGVRLRDVEATAGGISIADVGGAGGPDPN